MSYDDLVATLRVHLDLADEHAECGSCAADHIREAGAFYVAMCARPEHVPGTQRSLTRRYWAWADSLAATSPTTSV